MKKGSWLRRLTRERERERGGRAWASLSETEREIISCEIMSRKKERKKDADGE